MLKTNFYKGILFTCIASVFWGLPQPLFFNELNHVNFIEVVLHRGFWSFLFLFLILIYSIFKKVNFESDERTKLILVGCISLILMQVMIHVGVNIRLFPTTGMTLPYISYGGSSIVSVSIISGIILNLTKRKIN